MAQGGLTLGVDFGTSNSAAGYLAGGKPELIEMSAGEFTIPTTFFFDFDTRETLIGEPANRALLTGAEGRFMRALKRVLGTSLMHEDRQILNERVTFVEVIARFLRQIKARAEAQTGEVFDRAVSGRPVVFHKEGDPREAQAEADLRACYEAAGFKEVRFLAEPQAAAMASGVVDRFGEIGLIVDVGGGTTDYSLFQAGPSGPKILVNHGVRLGGTDFDRAVSIDQVMPVFGKGGDLRKVMGPGLSPIPNAIFNDLATWEKIPFLYTARTRSTVAEMARLAVEPGKMARLSAVLRDELGHDVAFAVERGKIAANGGSNDARIDLGIVEPALSAPLSVDDLAQSLGQYSDTLRAEALRSLDLAGLDASEVKHVVYVGGSSLMSVVSEAMEVVFPEASHSYSDVFTAVVNGLAIASGETAAP